MESGFRESQPEPATGRLGGTADAVVDILGPVGDGMHGLLAGPGRPGRTRQRLARERSKSAPDGSN
ncbi:hypothetical protein ACWC24_06620 [Streptomyces sp. NPDC001443]